MAIPLLESFDHFDTLSARGWAFVQGAAGSVSTSAFRTGTRGLRFTDGRVGIVKAFGGTATSGVIGGAFRISSLTHTNPIFGPWDTTYTAMITLHVDSLGRVYVSRYTGGGTGTTILGPTAGPVVTPSAWNYFEMAFDIHDTTGTVNVYQNGASILSGTSLDTKSGGNGYFNAVLLGAYNDQYGASSNFDHDDIYALTGSTTPLGDCKVECSFPSGNGTTSQLVGSDSNSTDNYLLVDEVPPSSSDYVGSGTVSQKDTYAFGNLATVSGTVHAVQVNMTAAKTEPGLRLVASVARLSGGTEADSANRALSTSYTMLSDIRETKPGGGAWTIADVNGAEFGVKVTA